MVGLGHPVYTSQTYDKSGKKSQRSIPSMGIDDRSEEEDEDREAKEQDEEEVDEEEAFVPVRVVRETWWPPRGTKKRAQRIITIEFKHGERLFKEQMLAQDLIDDHPGQVMVESSVFYQEVLANWR